jgi:hypothetical protein
VLLFLHKVPQRMRNDYHIGNAEIKIIKHQFSKSETLEDTQSHIIKST